METRSALFREIHKNTWLKRLTPEGKKITVGVKKSERNWVVFCVHDDTEALLEGYAEPRIAASHSPEWVVNLQTTQHISHALVPSEQEYEFVITLSNEVVRFHAISWEIMQEWVDTLRSKLREMKILSPKENLYTKLPEARAPLLPTRDPTSPLPATPPVPAAIVPGVECVVPLANSSSTSSAALNEPSTSANNRSITENTPTTPVMFNSSQSTNIVPQSNNIVAMSNTSTQNLLNMLNDPISNYSVQVSETSIGEENDDEESISSATNSINLRSNPSTSNSVHSSGALNKTDVSILAGTFSSSFLSDSNTRPALSNAISVKSNSIENSIRVDVNCLKGTSVDINSTSEPASPVESKVFSRPPTVRSISLSEPSVGRPSTSNNNITELDVQNNISELDVEPVVEPTTNITIIQVSNPLPVNKTPEIFKFPPPENLSIHEEYKSNVQIIPSSLSTIPVNTPNNQYSSAVKKNSESVVESSQVTKVHVTGKNLDTSYGNVCPSSSTSSPKIPKKIILSANTSGITNISVNNDINQLVTTSSTHYEKVFLTSSIPIAAQLTSDSTSPASRHALNLQRNDASQSDLPINLSRLRNKNTSVEINRNITNNKAIPSTSAANSSVRHRKSPAVTRRKAQLPDVGQENSPPPLTNRPLLTRGATEAVITARPSRIDMKKSRPRGPNNNAESHNPVDRTRSESLEQRRRSSSTSDVQSPRQKHGNSDARTRGQQPMQPIRLAQENAIVNASKRLTLREQQVLQLRREIMHPGGVRLKLRRKDCVGSIAWVDAFGAVWVAGWKQKDHPMLYNALHIGDQLISIAGIAISSAAEANKIIRNTNTLFLEILIRRIPFGRVYAIRRELEGQCLGLIRDGNTATIVDVVPNSLAARHGLPPKAQSCDGLSLTFWILTEVNGRPLNLFFKENEVRDRLNSVGRDISILVQPTDLVTKLKKQLKSLRSYKDYIVQ